MSIACAQTTSTHGTDLVGAHIVRACQRMRTKRSKPRCELAHLGTAEGDEVPNMDTRARYERHVVVGGRAPLLLDERHSHRAAEQLCRCSSFYRRFLNVVLQCDRFSTSACQ